MKHPLFPFLVAFVLWLPIVAVGFWVRAQSITQTIPMPLPMTMGGSGNSIGPQIPSSTVGTLPACNAATKGQIYFVTDSLAPALGVTIAASGAANVMIFCKGTN